MPSKISFFSGPVYRKHVGRFAPLWVVYLLLWLMILPLSILSQSGSVQYDLGSLQYTVLNSALHYGSYINLVYAIAHFHGPARLVLPFQQRQCHGRTAHPAGSLLYDQPAHRIELQPFSPTCWWLCSHGQLPRPPVAGFCLAAQWAGHPDPGVSFLLRPCRLLRGHRGPDPGASGAVPAGQLFRRGAQLCVRYGSVHLCLWDAGSRLYAAGPAFPCVLPALRHPHHGKEHGCRRHHSLHLPVPRLALPGCHRHCGTGPDSSRFFVVPLPPDGSCRPM